MRGHTLVDDRLRGVLQDGDARRLRDRVLRRDRGSARCRRGGDRSTPARSARSPAGDGGSRATWSKGARWSRSPARTRRPEAFGTGRGDGCAIVSRPVTGHAAPLRYRRAALRQSHAPYIMEITRKTGTDGLELAVEGRIDAYWADHLTAALDDAIRERLRPHRARPPRRRLPELGGHPHAAHRLPRARSRRWRAAHRPAVDRGQVDARDGGAARPARPLSHRAQGWSRRAASRSTVPRARSRAGRCAAAAASSAAPSAILPGSNRDTTPATADRSRSPPGSFGFGLGAFGRDFEDCRGRFGELLAAGGAAVYLPDRRHQRSGLPDRGERHRARGPTALRHALRRRAHASTRASKPSRGPPSRSGRWPRWRSSCSASIAPAWSWSAKRPGSSAPRCAGRPRSPADTPDFEFPEIRRWLSFTPDRAFAVEPGARGRRRGARAAGERRRRLPAAARRRRARRATSTPRRSRTGRCRAGRSSSRPPSRDCSRPRRRAGSSTCSTTTARSAAAARASSSRGALWAAPIARASAARAAHDAAARRAHDRADPVAARARRLHQLPHLRLPRHHRRRLDHARRRGRRGAARARHVAAAGDRLGAVAGRARRAPRPACCTRASRSTACSPASW